MAKKFVDGLYSENRTGNKGEKSHEKSGGEKPLAELDRQNTSMFWL
jgi:hypothetical protein